MRAWAQSHPAGPGPAWGFLHSQTALALRGVRDTPVHIEVSGQEPLTGPVLEKAPSAALSPGSEADRTKGQKEKFVKLRHLID